MRDKNRGRKKNGSRKKKVGSRSDKSGAKQEGERKDASYLLDFQGAGGRLFFRFLGKGHKAQKEPECLSFINKGKTVVSVLEKAV